MRQRIIIRGIVQGVGFRPFIYNLAHRFTLAGFVCNRTGDVLIEIEGPSSDVESFKRLIQIEAPSLSLIESMDCEEIDEAGDTHFVIQESESVADELVFISPDLATCEDCLREFFDRTDRRYHYPFLNCTNCGPRLTIIQSAPYDRERTTMSAFTMCESCQAEYDDPTDRRFHAQPTACSKCGPHLSSLPESDSPLLTMTRALVGGKIVALKGLGGYHLCCDARSEETVLRLRQRKHREEKPFAIMLRDLDQVRNFCEVNEIEAKMLTAPSRPIVLLKKQ